MSFRNLIRQLRTDRTILEIDDLLSPRLEVSRKVMDSQSPVIFTNVAGRKVVMNIIADRQLMAKALGTTPQDMVHYLADIEPDGTVVMVGDTPSQEVIEDEVDLSKVPVLTYFPQDGGPYITAGVVVSEYNGVYNASIHRLMVTGKDTMVGRLVENRHTYNLHKAASQAGEPLPIAVIIGIDPVVLLATTTRVPEGKEFQYASALLDRPVELFQLKNGIKVPHAEWVLEGYIDPQVRVDEGPFVDITGTLDIIRQEPLIHITRVMHRNDPIFHAIMPAGGEHKMLMGIPYEPLILKEVGKVCDVRNAVLTQGGCSYLHAIVQIHQTHKEDGKKAIDATFAAHRSLKHVVVIDDDIDIFNPSDVEYAIATRFRADRDLVVYPDVRGSSLDPMCMPNGNTTKMGLDATMILGEEYKFMRPSMLED
ncbi:MAG: UbiD family decarboxylase [Methanosarcinales archaeon]|nr:UbiD family decarboxylase [ANME-2 cluster archaeon]MDW7776316.1 UbiD family decarboxylase [Methanosarcinales archaeon]